MAANLERLRKGVGRDLFAPLTFRLALRLEQVAWQEFATDPSLASFALRSACSLFHADALINWFDDWMEAEAAGVAVERDTFGEVHGKTRSLEEPPSVDDSIAREPLRTVLDLTGRLCAEVGDRTAVLGYLTAGATLLGRLYGETRRDRILGARRSGKLSEEDKRLLDAAVGVTGAMANGYCERGISGLVMVEHDPVSSFDHFTAFDAVFNLAGYYGVPVMILARGPIDVAMAETAARCGATWTIALGVDHPDIAVLPLSAFSDGGDGIGRPGVPRRGCVFISEWDLAPDTEPSAVIALGERIARGA